MELSGLYALHWIAQSRPSWSSATKSMPASMPQRPVHSFQSQTFRSVVLYIGSLARNHLQTCSNCLPRTLGSGSRRAKRSLNVATAGMLIDGYNVQRRFPYACAVWGSAANGPRISGGRPSYQGNRRCRHGGVWPGWGSGSHPTGKAPRFLGAFLCVCARCASAGTQRPQLTLRGLPEEGAVGNRWSQLPR